jgi:hypothetical protein
MALDGSRKPFFSTSGGLGNPSGFFPDGGLDLQEEVIDPTKGRYMS